MLETTVVEIAVSAVVFVVVDDVARISPDESSTLMLPQLTPPEQRVSAEFLKSAVSLCGDEK